MMTRISSEHLMYVQFDEDFARQISNKYNDCSSPFSFQDRGVTYPNGETEVVHNIPANMRCL